MKIVSNTKDYYDHQAFVWGVDDHVVYARKSFGRRYIESDSYGKIERVAGLTFESEFSTFSVSYYSREISATVYRALNGWIVIAGRVFPLVDVNWLKNQRVSLHEASPSKIEVYNPKKHNQLGFMHFQPGKEYFDYVMAQKQDAIELSRLVGAPVFKIDSYQSGTVTIAEHVPNLGELGFPAIYPADQIFQDISYFMANQIKESPDVAPIGKPPQSNKEKIEAHGFDYKQSFRHRK